MLSATHSNRSSDGQKCSAATDVSQTTGHSVHTSYETDNFMKSQCQKLPTDTHNLPGCLLLTLISTLETPKHLPLPLTLLSIHSLQQLFTQCSEGHSSWTTVFWPSRGKPMVCGSGSCWYGQIWPSVTAARLQALVQPWQLFSDKA